MTYKFTNSNSKTPLLSEMWRVPISILGKYCALDADACFQLYKLFNEQVLSDPKFEVLDYYHKFAFIPNVKLLIEQQKRGILVDQDKVEKYKQELEIAIEDLKNKFLTLKEIKPFIEEYRQYRFNEYKSKTPKGKLNIEDDRFEFNINSKQQLEWLFFDCLEYRSFKQTDSGRRSVDKNTLQFLGEPGLILLEYNNKKKELGYVNACLASLSDSILYPHFKVPGTVTGRLGGGGSGGKGS